MATQVDRARDDTSVGGDREARPQLGQRLQLMGKLLGWCEELLGIDVGEIGGLDRLAQHAWWEHQCGLGRSRLG